MLERCDGVTRQRVNIHSCGTRGPGGAGSHLILRGQDASGAGTWASEKREVSYLGIQLSETGGGVRPEIQVSRPKEGSDSGIQTSTRGVSATETRGLDGESAGGVCPETEVWKRVGGK